MQELVGHCKECGKEIYCRDGFLDGIVLEDKSLICFDCNDAEKEDWPCSLKLSLSRIMRLKRTSRPITSTDATSSTCIHIRTNIQKPPDAAWLQRH
jgi:hypothetical protein